MTTTTQQIESIRYTIQAGNVSTEPVTRSALDRLARMTADALAAAFPGADVECPIEKTSGVRPAGYTRVTLSDYESDGAAQAGAEEAARETIAEVTSAAWERWTRSLADADLVREEE